MCICLEPVSYTHLDVYKRQQLADASTTQADAALIEAARPTLDESWVGFSLQSEDDPNDVILLAYQSATHVMIVAEQQK